MVLNNSIRELIYINNNKNHYENNLRSILPDIDRFGIEEMCQKNMIKISNKIIELKKVKKKKKKIHVEKKEESDSDIEELPDEISDDEASSEQKIKSDISYVEPPVKDDKLTNIPGDIEDSDIDVDEGLDKVVEDLDEGSDKDPPEKMDLGPNFLATTAPGWGAAKADVKPDEKIDKSGGSNMDNMLFSCLERIHKKGGGNKPNLTQNFKPKENYGGSGGPIKKIKLTEKYDFF
jgi:hypothetical protein